MQLFVEMESCRAVLVKKEVAVKSHKREDNVMKCKFLITSYSGFVMVLLLLLWV